MNWLSRSSSDLELSLEECLYEAVLSQDIDSVTTILTRGANPNKATCHGKTCLGAASHSGNVAIMKLLIAASGPSKKVEATTSVHKRNNRCHKRRLDRCYTSSENGSKCKTSECHAGNATLYCTQDKIDFRNRGYYVFIHDDEVISNESLVTTTSASITSTPSPLADMEWDEEVGSVAPSTTEDETYSSLYKWYAAILECTGAALASAANIASGIDQQDAFTKSAVHYAADQGQVEALRMLIEAGCKIDISANDGLYPLHTAAMRGHSDAVRLLIECGARVSCTTIDKMTPLHFAASRGYLEIVQMLVKAGAALETRESNDRTALFLAASCGHDEVISLLATAGANVNTEDVHGYTPLCEAVHQRHIKAVKVLLDAGVRITYSHRLLHNAVAQHQEEIVKLLATTGGINIHDDNGDTPLLLAVRTSQPSIARTLLKFGANVNSNDSITGATVMHVAIARIDSAKELEELLMDLLDYGGNINACSLYGDTALNRAILLHRDNAIVQLVRHGADPNLCNLQACTLDNLTLVARRSANFTRLLIKAGHELPAPTLNQPAPKPGTASAHIYYASRNPLTLTDLCRLLIRRIPRTIPLYRFVKSLFMPKIITSFLMLDDEA